MDGTLRLNLNENPFNPIISFKEELINRLLKIDINRYPDQKYSRLRRALAKKLSLREENVIVGNGSDELILYIFIAFMNANLPIVIPYPTFTMYEKIASLLNLRIVKVPLIEESWDLPMEDMEKALSEGAILFLAYPNNPTGNLWNRDKIEKLAAKNRGITVIDEAYYEFSGETMLNLIRKFDNVIILRTFSKAFGIAGARVGYAISNESLISRLEEVKLPFNLSAFSEEIALFLLEKEEWVKSCVEQIIQTREWFYNKLLNSSLLKVYPSRANFLLCKILKSDLNIVELLEKKNIKIRKPDINGNYIRISIGKREEVEGLWLSLKELQEKLT